MSLPPKPQEEGVLPNPAPRPGTPQQAGAPHPARGAPHHISGHASPLKAGDSGFLSREAAAGLDEPPPAAELSRGCSSADPSSQEEGPYPLWDQRL